MPIDVQSEAEIKLKLKEFLRRDYGQDVERLNANLGERDDAGFTDEMPPLPFAGDPFGLEPGNCIAVIGINPKWDKRKSKPDEIESKLKACVDLFRRGDDKQFDEFLLLRASEFNGGPYYWRYYTKLGNHLFREWLQGKVCAVKEGPIAAKEVFRRYVLKTDLLPWYSVNTNKIAPEKVSTSRDGALLLHFEILSLLIRSLKPKWLQFNGSQMVKTIAAITDAKLTSIPLSEGAPIAVGRSARFDTPILVHQFVNRAGGPQSAKDFKLVAQAFRDWLRDDSYFEFH